MKEGYYISAFVCVNELQNIMDIKLRHDQTIALWKYENNRIELVRYWELERISGIKMHPKAFYNKVAFFELLEDLLKEEGLKVSDIVSIWGTPEIESNTQYRDWIDKRFAFHSIAHLLTAICFDNDYPFDSTIFAMALDAGPDSKFEPDAYEKLYYSACIIKDSNISFFPVESPARLWSYSYKKFGLREGTLMALANATKVSCDVDEYTYNRWLSFEFINETSRYNSQVIVDEITEYVNRYVEDNLIEYDVRFSIEDNIISMVMKIISKLSLEIVNRNIEKAIREYEIDPNNTIIALAGGFALNCPTNTAIIEKYNFKGFQIPPCATDTGIAMGIGLGGFYELILQKKASVNISSAYYGEECGSVVDLRDKYPQYIEDIKKASMYEFANLIKDGEILVWINGKAEIGPRALGNRSLLGDSRSTMVKNKLNELKKRQWWRPVAPIVLDECGKEYFMNYRTTYNMLLNLYTLDDMVEKVPAIVHHDNSARVQSVSSKSNDILYELLKEFYKLTGVPILCNTSLNDAGEPIINKIDEAVKFAINKDLKYICVDGKYLVKLRNRREKKDCQNTSFELRRKEYFEPPHGIDIDKIKKEKNPHELNIEYLTYYFDNPNVFYNRSLLTLDDVSFIKEKAEIFIKKNKYALKR